VTTAQPSSVDASEVPAKVVSEVLGIPVSAENNLLELGVDSLIATRIVVIIRSILNVDVPISALFENPVMGDFAMAVADLADESEG
jgi:acyl carrier protein